MRIAIFGGSFNPPHLGHREVVKNVLDQIHPDRFMIIPDNIPPHKELESGSPDAHTRLQMCLNNFSDMQDIQISEMEIVREGRSYTAETVDHLRVDYPEDELLFVMGTDMLMSFEEWYRFEYLLEQLTLVVLARNDGDAGNINKHAEYLNKKYSAKIQFVDCPALPMSSTQIRAALKNRGGNEFLKEEVYQLIIKKRLYDAQVNLSWLEDEIRPLHKKNRMSHVLGVKEEAIRLAQRWGADPDDAAEAGLLHDVTKKLAPEDQLILIDKYGIIISNIERENYKLLHAITGAQFAREQFGVSDEIYNAIRWHTTGKPAMSLLEKIIYLADFIEPNRTFPGVNELRKQCYDNIDNAMELALKMSLDIITERGDIIHPRTQEAYEWYHRKD